MAVAHPPVVLVGGEEFTEAAEPLHREVLKIAGAGIVNVAILPTAAQPENPYLAAAHGIAHFRRLGADPYGVMILDKTTADAPMLVGELAGADIIYLTGGRPAHLLESLRDSLAWKRMREMHVGGVMIAGSSAGAMVLCESIALDAEETRALGLVPGVRVLPHFERVSEERIEQLAKRAREGPTYLGIDGATGVVRVGGAWRVAGPGRAYVMNRSGAVAFRAGETFSLD